MDAVELLKNDHRKVEALFKELDINKNSQEAVEDIFHELKRELDTHAHIEEAIFYPAVKNVSTETVEHFYHENSEMKNALAKLEREDFGKQEWIDGVKDLQANVEKHVQEEETEILPKAAEILGKDRLEKLGSDMANEKEVFLAQIDESELEKNEPII